MDQERLARIRELLGEGEAALVESRQRGGSAGQRGSRFEDLVAIRELALAIRELDESEVDWIAQAQATGFVDDFVRYSHQQGCFIACQAKAVARLRWRDVESAFRNERRMLESEGWRDIRLRLIISHAALVALLRAECPNGLVVEVAHQPWAEQGISELAGNAQWADPIRWLMSREWAPERAVAVCAQAMLGIWVGQGQGQSVRVSDYWRQLRAAVPAGLLRSSGQHHELAQEICALLTRLPALRCTISRGWLHWEYGDTDRGTVPHAIDSHHFGLLAARWRQTPPQSFDDVELELCGGSVS